MNPPAANSCTPSRSDGDVFGIEAEAEDVTPASPRQTQLLATMTNAFDTADPPKMTYYQTRAGEQP